jgi:hypothetical protein
LSQADRSSGSHYVAELHTIAFSCSLIFRRKRPLFYFSFIKIGRGQRIYPPGTAFSFNFNEAAAAIPRTL